MQVSKQHQIAVRVYNACRVRVPVPLSAQALQYCAAHPSVVARHMRPRSAAGLSELAVEMQARRGMFETNIAFAQRVLAERSMQRAITLAQESAA